MSTENDAEREGVGRRWPTAESHAAFIDDLHRSALLHARPWELIGRMLEGWAHYRRFDIKEHVGERLRVRFDVELQPDGTPRLTNLEIADADDVPTPTPPDQPSR